MTSGPRSYQPFWVVMWTATLSLFGFLAAPLVTKAQFVADDLGNYHLPFRSFYSHALHAGDSFLWCPLSFSGFYLQGEGQVGMTHPVHLFLYRVLSLDTAFALEILLYYLFAFIGGYGLFWKWTTSRPAAFAGAFTLTFGGFYLLRIVHINAVGVCAHIPWVLLVVHRMFEERRSSALPYWCAALAALTASQILLGYPQYLLFSMLIEAWYLLYLSDRPKWLRRAALAGGAHLLGALVGAIQLAPTFTALTGSTRFTPTGDFLAQVSLPPLNFLQWINPFVLSGGRAGQYGLHEFGIYAGIGPFLLFAWLAFGSGGTSEQGRLVRFLVALAAGGAFLALGQYNQVFRLYSRLPILNVFRAAARFFVLVHFAFAGGCALAVSRLEKKPDIEVSHGFAMALIGVVLLSVATLVLSCVAALSNARALDWVARGRLPLFGGILVASAAGLLLASRRYPRQALALFFLTSVLDLMTYDCRYLRHIVAAGGDLPNVVRIPPVPPPGPVATDRNGDALITAGYRLCEGYAGLEPAKVLRLDDPVYWRLAGAQAVERQPEGWERLTNSLPRARLVFRILVSAAPERDIAQLDIAQSAVTSEPLAVDSESSGTARIVEDRPGRIRISTVSGGRALLVLGERFHPGWTARVDGSPERPWRVNGDFIGLPVGPGEHQVDLTFAPADFLLGAKLTGLGVILLLLMAVIPMVIKPRPEDF